MNKIKYLPWVLGAGVALSLAAVIPVFAATTAVAGGAAGASGHFGEGRGGAMMGPGPAKIPGVFGTVSAVSGDTLSVTQMTRPNATTTPVVYSVDATNAKVIKNGTSSTVSAIATGDSVMVQGTVTGTNVAATVIRDGVGGMLGGRGMKGGFGRGGSSSTMPVSPIQGNGEPVLGGSITAISGNSLKVTNTSNVTYTIDVSNAKIVKNGTTTTASVLATGDTVVVQGTVNGTAVTASSVIDQGAAAATSGTGASASNSHPGFFGSIGSFFKHIFGF